MTWWTIGIFVAGLLVGGTFGVLAAALASVNREQMITGGKDDR